MVKINWFENIKGIVLLALAGIFIQKYVSGNLYNYISPRFGWLAILGAVLLALMALSIINLRPAKEDPQTIHPGHDHEKEHKTSFWALILISVPLLMGILIPSHPLGASQVANQGVSTGLSAPSSDLQVSLKVIPAERNVLDWVRAIGANPDPASLNGQQANVIGFVYRDIHYASDQFMIARFAVSCCVADARAIGLVVTTPDAAQYATGEWLEVKGHFSAGKLDASPIPVILADAITPVEQPAQPYLYP